MHGCLQCVNVAKPPTATIIGFSEAGVPAFFIYTLGGITAYHDVKDVAKTLPLTKYDDVCLS
jgi:uncharacterized membrane protein